MTTKRVARGLAAGLALLTAGAVAPAMAPPAAAAPAGPFPMRPCPASFTTGTCLGGRFAHGTDTGGGESDGGSGDDTASDPPADTDGGGGDPVGPPATAPPPPTPEEIQHRILQRANTYFTQPEVTVNAGLNPAVELASAVNVATFVEVANWQGPQTDLYEEGGFWVRIDSTPTLYFDPGEPGSRRIRCEPGGTAYVPAREGGASVEEQASRPGACAYPYTMRTGVDGRPDAWPAEVVIEWDVVWTANFDLPGDLPDSATLTESVPRQVCEISSVVADESGSGRQPRNVCDT
jgi:hypothetical protein